MFVELVDYKNKANMLDKRGGKDAADEYDILIKRIAKFISNIHQYDLSPVLIRRLACAKNVYLKNIKTADLDGEPLLIDYDPEKFGMNIGAEDLEALQQRAAGDETGSQYVDMLSGEEALEIFTLLKKNPNSFPKMPLNLFSQLLRKHAGEEVEDIFINSLSEKAVEYELLDRLSGLAEDLKINAMSRAKQQISESQAISVVNRVVEQTLRSLKKNRSEHPLYQNIESENFLELMKHFIGNVASKIRFGVQEESPVQKNVNPLSKTERIIFGSVNGAAKLKTAIYQIMEQIGTSDPTDPAVEEYVMTHWDFSASSLEEEGDSSIISPDMPEDLYKVSSSLKSAVADAKKIEEQNCRSNPEECNTILANNDVDTLIDILNSGYADDSGEIHNTGMLYRFAVHQAAFDRGEKETSAFREFVRVSNEKPVNEYGLNRAIKNLAEVLPPVNLEFNDRGEVGIKYSGNQDFKNNKIEAVRKVFSELHENGNLDALKNYSTSVSYAIAVKQILAGGGMQSLQESGGGEDARELGDRLAIPEQSVSMESIMDEAAVSGDSSNAVQTVARIALESYLANKPLDAGKLSARRNKNIYVKLFSDLIAGNVDHEGEEFDSRLTRASLPKIISWIESRYGKLEAEEESGRQTITEKDVSPEKEFIKTMLFDDEFNETIQSVYDHYRKRQPAPEILDNFDPEKDAKTLRQIQDGTRRSHLDYQKFLTYLSFGLGIPEKNLAHVAFANDPHTKLNAAKANTSLYCTQFPERCSENPDLVKTTFAPYNSTLKGNYIKRMKNVSNDDDNMDIDMAMYLASKYVQHSHVNKKARNIGIRAIEADDTGWSPEADEETKKRVSESYYYMRLRNLLKSVELDNLTHMEMEGFANMSAMEGDTKAHPFNYSRNTTESYKRRFNGILASYVRKLSTLLRKVDDDTDSAEFIKIKTRIFNEFRSELSRVPGIFSNAIASEDMEDKLIGSAVNINNNAIASGINIDDMRFEAVTYGNCVAQYSNYLKEIVGRLQTKISDYDIQDPSSPEFKMLSHFEAELTDWNKFAATYSGEFYRR